MHNAVHYGTAESPVRDNCMEYVFRPNLFQKHRGVRLVDDRIELFDADGQVQRSEQLTSVRNVQTVHAGTVEDPDSGRCDLEHCIIRFTRGRTVILKSASYTGPKQAVDYTDRYTAFVDELVQQLARSSPEVPIYSGSRGLVMTWIVIAAGAAGLFALGVAILLSPLYRNESLGDVVLPGAVLTFFAVLAGMISVGMARTYRPSCRSAREVAEGGDVDPLAESAHRPPED